MLCFIEFFSIFFFSQDYNMTSSVTYFEDPKEREKISSRYFLRYLVEK